MGCAGFLRKCFIRISASGGPAMLLTWGTAFSALPDLFTCFHQLTSFCHFFFTFRRLCPKLYSGLGICRKFLTLRPRGVIEDTTIANVFYFWLLPMQWGLKILTALWDLIIQKHGNIAKLKESFLPHQSSRGRPRAVGWEPAFEPKRAKGHDNAT